MVDLTLSGGWLNRISRNRGQVYKGKKYRLNRRCLYICTVSENIHTPHEGFFRFRTPILPECSLHGVLVIPLHPLEPFGNNSCVTDVVALYSKSYYQG